VQHLLFQGRVVAEEVAEQGDQDQQQGQEGEEAVVGHQGGEVAALVVAELLHHREGHAGPGVLLLIAVDAPQRLFGRFMGCLLPGLVRSMGHALGHGGGVVLVARKGGVTWWFGDAGASRPGRR
jgi:hypothetical protein